MSLPVPALHIDAASPVPPFEQLRSQIAKLAAAGDLGPGSKLPTVRQLAADLHLAANTVARAYRELEGDGVLVTEGRRGTFVAVVAPAGDHDADLARLTADLVAAARRAGRTLPEALLLIERAWSGR